MTKSITIYYRDLPSKQVSTDEKTWISVSGYNNYGTPYFNLTEEKDWCSIETSKNGVWLICFVKIQNNGEPIYYRSFSPVNILDNIIIFECEQVIKDNNTSKWIKKDIEQTTNFNYK